VIQTLQALPALVCAARATAAANGGEQIQLFKNHWEYLHYAARSAEGCPVGNGAMESLYGQPKGCLKRGGQFGLVPGRRRLMALEVARRNHGWDKIWWLN